MLTELCHELKNWFERSKHIGSFVVENGEIKFEDGSPLPLQNGQYFRIIGSIFNDGVYLHPYSDLKDEAFDGAIWALAIPKEIIDLSDDIDKWQAKYGDVNSEAMSPFTSESFGGYSYSKSGGGASTGSSNSGTWQSTFASKLNKWRKI